MLSSFMVKLGCLGVVQVVLCYNRTARWLPLFLDRISDLKPAGVSFGARMNNKRIGIGQQKTEIILERDAYVCGYCNGQAVLADHITPWVYTQDNSEENLIACCVECNQIASSFVFDSLAEKRLYVVTVRAGKRWTKKLKNKYSRCVVCGEAFSEGSKGATHFICPECRSNEYEYKEDYLVSHPNLAMEPS